MTHHWRGWIGIAMHGSSSDSRGTRFGNRRPFRRRRSARRTSSRRRAASSFLRVNDLKNAGLRYRTPFAATLCVGVLFSLGCGAGSPEKETPAELDPNARAVRSEDGGRNQAACEQGILKESWTECDPSEFTFENRCFSSSKQACSCAGCLSECNLLESAPVQVRCPGAAGRGDGGAMTDPAGDR